MSKVATPCDTCLYIIVVITMWVAGCSEDRWDMESLEKLVSTCWRLSTCPLPLLIVPRSGRLSHTWIVPNHTTPHPHLGGSAPHQTKYQVWMAPHHNHDTIFYDQRYAKCLGYDGHIRLKIFAGWDKFFGRTRNFVNPAAF